MPQILRPPRVRPSITAASAGAQLGVLAVLGTAAILWAGQGSNQVTVSLTLIYVTFAMAWNIVAGYAGQFTFGHAAFFGIGAYAATLMTELAWRAARRRACGGAWSSPRRRRRSSA